MGRYHRLCRRSGAGGKVLSRHPAILADIARWRAGAGIFGDPAQDRAAGGGGAGFPDPGATGSWRRRADQFVRDRIARTDIIAGNRRLCRRARRGVGFFAAQAHLEGVSAIALIPWVAAVLAGLASAAFRPRYASTARSRP